MARDYLFLTQNALRNANEREANASRLHNRVGAEDVNEAAADLTAQKQDDLAIDVGEDADRLRARLTDIVEFCLDVNKTNVFLVEGPTLQEEQWGSDIQALADLRLVHAIGNLSVQTGTYRGRRFVGFTLDLSNYTGTRSERIEQIEFWTPGGKQATRRARLIYAPGAADRPPARDEEDPRTRPWKGCGASRPTSSMSSRIRRGKPRPMTGPQEPRTPAELDRLRRTRRVGPQG